MRRLIEPLLLIVIIVLTGLAVWPTAEMISTGESRAIAAQAEANTEELEAYFAWCKLKHRWDIRLNEWRALRKQHLLP